MEFKNYCSSSNYLQEFESGNTTVKHKYIFNVAYFILLRWSRQIIWLYKVLSEKKDYFLCLIKVFYQNIVTEWLQSATDIKKEIKNKVNIIIRSKESNLMRGGFFIRFFLATLKKIRKSNFLFLFCLLSL